MPMNQAKKLLQNNYIRGVLIAVIVLVLFVAAGFGYAFASTPGNIRNPGFEHLHFRMQLMVNGKAENFAGKQYQQGYAADNCNAALTLNPIHFHDNKDQFVHIHWANITGGQVLKYYGWNEIGGTDGLMGYRFDTFPNLVAVPIHGPALPKLPKDAKFYVYTGDQNSYKQRDYQDFLHTDLETFFNKQSTIQQKDSLSLLDKLFPKASAQDMTGMEGMDMTDTTKQVQSVTHTQDELKRLNNVIGSVVIFVQKDKPTDQQIKAKFDNLLPVSESACAG
jgi:hypothetical protein